MRSGKPKEGPKVFYNLFLYKKYFFTIYFVYFVNKQKYSGFFVKNCFFTIYFCKNQCFNNFEIVFYSFLQFFKQFFKQFRNCKKCFNNFFNNYFEKRVPWLGPSRTSEGVLPAKLAWIRPILRLPDRIG